MGMLTSALANNSMDPQTLRMQAALGQLGGALQGPGVQGGLLTNGQMGALPIDAQGLVNHTRGGQFGGLPEVPETTPLDEQRALTAAMDNHDFGGAVARQDATGRAYFADPTVPNPLDPQALASAEGGLADKGFLKTDAGWRPSAGRAEQVRRAPGAVVARPPAQGQLLQQPARGNGIASEADRRANVTRRAQSRGLQRDFNSGAQSPDSMLLNALTQGGGGGLNSPMGAGMMFGPGGFIAATQAAENARQFDQRAEYAKSDQSFVDNFLQNNPDATMDDVKRAMGARQFGQPGFVPPAQPFHVNPELASGVAMYPNTLQGYDDFVRAAGDRDAADVAWRAAGRNTNPSLWERITDPGVNVPLPAPGGGRGRSIEWKLPWN